MSIVVNFLLLFGVCPVAIFGDGDLQEIVDQGLAFVVVLGGFQRELNGTDVHRVVVKCMQGGSSGRGHPGSIGTGFGMCDFLLQHRGHQVGHGPHAFADLSASP